MSIHVHPCVGISVEQHYTHIRIMHVWPVVNPQAYVSAIVWSLKIPSSVFVLPSAFSTCGV